VRDTGRPVKKKNRFIERLTSYTPQRGVAMAAVQN
jgi:hypothetical protein